MLASRITKLIVSTFNSLQTKSGKPIIRSNGIKEWTVLAGIVALIPNESKEYDIVPLTLSTGVKALPNKVREYSNGLFVHDAHAEILSLRLFNWYLMDECYKLKNDNQYVSKVVESGVDFSIKKDIKFALYISEPPCGDASMSYLSKGETPWQEKVDKRKLDLHSDRNEKRRKISGDVDSGDISTGNGEISEVKASSNGEKSEINVSTDKNRLVDSESCRNNEYPNSESPPTLVRGREHFNKLGLVRTKPGRVDSLLTLSKSCSDKLCIKQLTGITNTFTSLLFPRGVFLDYLVLQEDKYHEQDFVRCFHTRFADKLNNVRKLEVLTYDEDDYTFHKPVLDSNTAPSLTSLLYVVPSQTLQVLNNGVKLGCFVKNKQPKKGGESFICNQRMFSKFNDLQQKIDAKSYLELKEANHCRSSLVKKAKSTLEGWSPTDRDDFQL